MINIMGNKLHFTINDKNKENFPAYDYAKN